MYSTTQQTKMKAITVKLIGFLETISKNILGHFIAQMLLFIVTINTDENQGLCFLTEFVALLRKQCKGKVHPCTDTEALYRPYGP